MEALNTIVELSHEFGVAEYVKAGGGNTSVKNETTLRVKASGTTLGGLTAEKCRHRTSQYWHRGGDGHSP